ncbi:SCO6880 family protein [Euzebya tangerina]|uniref:SCO6880 family protein n=1 Tax=Euzebya tangerina TaxID=591198 RepID=UPI000E321158|nr:SCO6880 family protein [Euzebya tangerina]
MTGPTTQPQLDPVRLARLPARGILLGLTLGQLVAGSVALVALLAGLYIAGTSGVLVAAPVWVPALLLTVARVGGRPVVAWLPTVAAWLLRRHRGQTRLRRRDLMPRPTGVVDLPGDTGSLVQYTDSQTGTVMLHDPTRRWLITIAEVSHRTFALQDGADQQRRVHGWGRLLATICRSGQIARVQVLEEAVPDSGNALNEWWEQHGSDDGSWVAQTYAALIKAAGPTAQRHQTSIAIALDIAGAARQIRAAGGGLTGAAAVLRQEMTTIASAAQAADLTTPTWITPHRLATRIRTTYDPSMAAGLERLGEHLDIAEVGPVALDERWDGLRTDSAHHAVLWISAWPRSQVYPGFIAPIVLASGVRRTITLIAEPVPAETAARSIRRSKTEYQADAAQRVRIGQTEHVDRTAEYHDVLQQEADLTAGHGLLRYAALIAISAPTLDQLQAATAQIQQAAIQASCDTRLLVGQQPQALIAAALPLCRGL